MQVHGPSQITDRVEGRLNPGGPDRPAFGVLTIGSVEIYIYTVAEAATLGSAIQEIERLLTAAQDDGDDIQPLHQWRPATGDGS